MTARTAAVSGYVLVFLHQRVLRIAVHVVVFKISHDALLHRVASWLHRFANRSATRRRLGVLLFRTDVLQCGNDARTATSDPAHRKPNLCDWYKCEVPASGPLPLVRSFRNSALL